MTRYTPRGCYLAEAAAKQGNIEAMQSYLPNIDKEFANNNEEATKFYQYLRALLQDHTTRKSTYDFLMQQTP
jgi:hypothetical protein